MVNLAARIAKRARPGRILLDDDCASVGVFEAGEEAKDRKVIIKSVGKMAFKGFSADRQILTAKLVLSDTLRRSPRHADKGVT